eukprot:1391691-Amphidinium_carterae.1
MLRESLQHEASLQERLNQAKGHFETRFRDVRAEAFNTHEEELSRMRVEFERRLSGAREVDECTMDERTRTLRQELE